MLNWLVGFLLISCSTLYGEARLLIIGGEDVSPVGKWPFMVSQQDIFAGQFQHNCGASLIGEDWLLTTAHCVDTFTPSEIFAVLGAHDIQTQEQGDPEYYDIEEIIIHPNWSDNPNDGYPNDIALLRLSTAADTSSEFVAIVPMANESDGDFAGESCYIIAWGLFDFDDGSGELPNILQEAEMNVLSNDECIEEWGDEYIHPSQVCVEGENKSSCTGDSGGPLVCQVAGTWTLVGATSWGTLCPTIAPSVYARVSSYRDWITENTGL